jgi:hypothetical protein
VKERAGIRRESATPSPLPSDKAFVVQLARSTDPSLRSFAGRVEHLASGRRRRFESVGQFLEQVVRLLSEEQKPAGIAQRRRRGL